MKAGDILIRLDGETVTGVDDTFRLLDERRIEKVVSATVLRGGECIDVPVRPVERER
jgi:S1-C subfamily serine protease